MGSLLHSVLRKPMVAPAPDFAEVSYGTEHPRQSLDFWRGSSTSNQPAPLLVFFHGGGFLCGRKYYCRLLREMRARGVATVAANYRLVRRRGTTVADSMNDGALVLDFVKARANDWGIDPERIALMGKSSGGCIAMWLGLRISGIKGVATYNAPTSIDPDLLVREIGVKRIEWYWPLWGPMGDIVRPSELRSERVQKLIRRFSPLDQVHDRGAPLYLEYTGDRPGASISWLEALHCVRYGELMQNRYRELGLSCTLAAPSLPPAITPVQFMCKALGVEDIDG